MSLTLVVGPGKAGRALALAHCRAGDDVLLAGRRDGEWQDWARGAGIEATRVDALPVAGHPATLLFAVPDDALAAAVADVERAGVRAGIAAHVSGLHGVEALAALSARGAATAALHPVLQFLEPEADAQALREAQVTVACAAADRAAAHAVVARWGGQAIDMPTGVDRRRYHLGLAVASNHVTALFALAEDLLRSAFGEHARAQVARMAGQAVSAAAERGAEAALTGPVVRGDVQTVAAHLAALDAEEGAQYAGLLLSVIALAERSGRLDAARAAELRKLARRDD